MNIQDKLIHFQKNAMESARLQSNSMIDEYTEGLEKIYQEFRAEKDRQAQLQIQSETDRLTSESNKTLHEQQLAIRRELTDHINDLKQQLFSEVSNLLEEFMNTPAYEDWLVDHIKKAKKFARDEEIIIYIDPNDEKRLFSLEERTYAHLTVSQYSFFGGMRAVIPSKHILIDDSFETKLKEEKENFTFGGISHGK